MLEPTPGPGPSTPGFGTTAQPKGLVERAKDIITKPNTEWEVIDREPSTIAGIYTSYVMILAAIPAIAGAIGLLVFGLSSAFITIRLSTSWIIANAVTGYILSLVMVYVLALIIEALAPNFGGTKDRLKAFKVAAYSYTPAWVAGILSIIPTLGMIAGLVGGIYALYLLYLGLPRLMRTPQDKALTYVIVVILAAIVLFFVVGAIVGAVTRVF